MTPTAYILQLARTFPCLKIKLEGYNPDRFDADEFHALTRGWSKGEYLCAIFILNVWNPGFANERGWNFDLIEFVSIADGRNRQALIDWLKSPRFP